MTRPMRRNGIVRVPKLWLDAAVEAFDTLLPGGGGQMMIPLPLKAFPYPKIREGLLAIYPEKFVPLFFKVGPISAEGSTSTKHNGGYTVAINSNSDSSKASLISTILHELRHVVQYLGDEVVKAKHGTFGRPSKAAVASLRARKQAMKAGKIAGTGMQKYLSSASEWQPWVGTTADKIVKQILAGGLTKTADVNAAIRSGILSSTIYGGTDPATRKELMRQVYTEIMRQLKGYTDVIPAKHPKAAAPGSYAVHVKIEGAAPSIANEATYAGKDSKGRDTLKMGFALSEDARDFAYNIAEQTMKGTLFHGGTVYAIRVRRTSDGMEWEIYGPKVIPHAKPKKNPRRTRRAPRRRAR